jgi:hypothetical protein
VAPIIISVATNNCLKKENNMVLLPMLMAMVKRDKYQLMVPEVQESTGKPMDITEAALLMEAVSRISYPIILCKHLKLPQLMLEIIKFE